MFNPHPTIKSIDQHTTTSLLLSSSMAAAPRGREAVQHWKDRSVSPERTVVWTEPKSRSSSSRKVPVVYYLSRNGHLEHPHFMEVPLSSPDGLYLKDVTNRLNLLRGNGIAAMYSWSSKRSYKNGFVWHDLTEDDFIHPAHGLEYVLKGSELLAAPAPPETPKPTDNDPDISLRRKSPSRWKSLDLNEYKVYKNELTSSDSSSAAADASTQTDDRLRRRAIKSKNTEEVVEKEENAERDEIEISPPPSSSSPETLETLIGADRRLIRTEAPPPAMSYPSGRIRASAVLMQLISCGSLSVNDPPEISAMREQYRRRETGSETPMMFPAVRPEDRDCFSGSLIETKKVVGTGSGGEGGELAGLKRSSSYNADRGSKLELEKEEDGVRARCIPRKPKTTPRKEGNPPVSRSTHGSKRINDEQTRSLQN